jgi:hypothetical protein
MEMIFPFDITKIIKTDKDFDKDKDYEQEQTHYSQSGVLIPGSVSNKEGICFFVDFIAK